MARLALAFFADDFTGATDALASLATAGLRTRLFLEASTAAEQSRTGEWDAIGVAGMTRALDPIQLDAQWRPALQALVSCQPEFIHYKVCSTFDSSPHVGSIGRAIDIAFESLQPNYVPLMVAAPSLGRYCAFGNLFARLGAGADGVIHRLDRLPTMREHPVTPMDESDLRIHLSKQTEKTVGLFSVLDLALEPAEASARLNITTSSGTEVVLFDGVYDEHLAAAGRFFVGSATPGRPMFIVGSSGASTAVAMEWSRLGRFTPRLVWDTPLKGGPLLVASGSRSTITREQINRAVERGFAVLRVSTSALIDAARKADECKRIVQTACGLVKEGRHIIVDAAQESVDAERFRNSSGSPHCSSKSIGSALGEIVRSILRETTGVRVCFAGGDTSSYAARALGIESLEMLAPLAPGAPLCTVHSCDPTLDGCEIIFKGGQVGSPDFLLAAAEA